MKYDPNINFCTSAIFCSVNMVSSILIQCFFHSGFHSKRKRFIMFNGSPMFLPRSFPSRCLPGTHCKLLRDTWLSDEPKICVVTCTFQVSCRSAPLSSPVIKMSVDAVALSFSLRIKLKVTFHCNLLKRESSPANSLVIF